MFEEEYLKFWQEFGKNKKMVLSTAFHDKITSRTMSVINLNSKLYFQTDNTSRKYGQLKKNPHVALCTGNIQIEGVCHEIGSPTENKDFCNAYKDCFTSSFHRYTLLKNERLFVVSPTFIERWVYVGNVPYIQIFDVKNRKYISKQYLAGGEKMSFQLDHVVPWGRNMDEYRSMFALSDEDMKKNIADFGGGPSAFNCEATAQGGTVTSFDPIYQFSREDLQNRIEETRTEIMRQMEENKDNYVWTQIKSLEDLEQTRMSAMEMFLEDYERGRARGRYRFHELPASLPVRDQTFDIGLSSHFLLMYDGLGIDFHIRAITEMLRVCKEVRIFPIVDLDAKPSELTANVIKYFQTSWFVELLDTSYEFQKGGNRMLRIAKKMAGFSTEEMP